MGERVALPDSPVLTWFPKSSIGMPPRQPEKDDLPSGEPDSNSLTRNLTPIPLLIAQGPFGSLSAEVLALIQSNMTEEQFSPGSCLMRKGEPGTSLILLEAGEVEVSVGEGADRHVLRRVGPGEILGEMALLTKEPRMATVTAVTPVRARSMSASRFDELATRHPSISVFLTLLLASRLGTAPHDAMTGNTFHGYRILRCAGTGGMSVVYEAEDTRAGRRVALKMMSHRLLYDPVARRHFDREVDIVRSFNHPNIARTFGQFEAFRTSFIVMEFCEGISIADAMASREPLDEPIVRRVLGQIARGVDHAHKAGVVHRDIKPSNIMIVREGTAKLIDFGLAGQLEEGLLAPALFGTPHYMAPEQLTGEPVGERIDLFALGHVAFEMLSGRRLLRGKNLGALKGEMAGFQAPDLESALPGVTAEMRRVLEGMLKKDPEQRRLDFEQVCAWAGPILHERFRTA